MSNFWWAIKVAPVAPVRPDRDGPRVSATKTTRTRNRRNNQSAVPGRPYVPPSPGRDRLGLAGPSSAACRTVTSQVNDSPTSRQFNGKSRPTSHWHPLHTHTPAPAQNLAPLVVHHLVPIALWEMDVVVFAPELHHVDRQYSLRRRNIRRNALLDEGTGLGLRKNHIFIFLWINIGIQAFWMRKWMLLPLRKGPLGGLILKRLSIPPISWDNV